MPRSVCLFAARNDLASLASLAQTLSSVDLELRVRQVDAQGVSPLMHACRRGFDDMARVLLNMGAWKDVNKSEPHRGSTALIIAAAYGWSKCVRELARHSRGTLQPGLVDPQQWSALVWASYNGRPRCVLLLLWLDSETVPVLALFHAARAGRLLCCALLSSSVAWRLFLWSSRLWLLALRAALSLPLSLARSLAQALLVLAALGWSALVSYGRQRRLSLAVARTPGVTPRAAAVAVDVGAAAGAVAGAVAGVGAAGSGRAATAFPFTGGG